MKPCIEEEYILQLCTWVLVFSCGEKCPHGTYSKIAIFRENRNQLFRARSPNLLGRIKRNLVQRKNIHRSCALGYWFSRAMKNVPMVLIRKLQFFVKIELSFSALDLLYYWEESNEALYRGRIYIVVVHLGIGFPRATKNVPMGLIRFSAL